MLLGLRELWSKRVLQGKSGPRCDLDEPTPAQSKYQAAAVSVVSAAMALAEL